MSFVITAPEIVTAVATDLASLDSSLSAAKAAAAPATTAVVTAAEDEVSAAVAALFSAHGQGFQALSAQAAAFHNQFVQTLNSAGGAYAAAEAAGASPLAAVVQGAQRLTVLSTVKQLANAYTRGVGFTAGVPNADIASVIRTAAARLIANPTQLLTDETVGPESASFRTAWTGWTVPELFALNRYRVRAQ